MSNPVDLCATHASQDEIIATHLDMPGYSTLSDEEAAQAIKVSVEDVRRVRNDPSILANYRAWQDNEVRKSDDYLHDELMRKEAARHLLRESIDRNITTWLPIYKAIGLVAQTGMSLDEAWEQIKECIRLDDVNPKCKIPTKEKPYSKTTAFDAKWIDRIDRIGNAGDFGEDYSILIGTGVVNINTSECEVATPVQAFFVRDIVVQESEIKAIIARAGKASGDFSGETSHAAVAPTVTTSMSSDADEQPTAKKKRGGGPSKTYPNAKRLIRSRCERITYARLKSMKPVDRRKAMERDLALDKNGNRQLPQRTEFDRLINEWLADQEAVAAARTE